MKLENQVALVTGGGTGIGAAIARALAAEGARLLLVGRRKEPLEAVQGELGECARTCLGDISRPDDCRRAVLEAVRAFGKLTLLVNNAGSYQVGPLDKVGLEDFRAIMETNLFGPLCLSGLAAEAMRAAGGGAIVNVSSTLGLKGVPNVALYSASKAALNMLTRCAALELAADKIRVNCVAPAVVRTPAHRQDEGSAEADAYYQQMAPMHPLGRVGWPDEVARAVLFFALPENAWITGAVLPVDGGMTAG